MMAVMRLAVAEALPRPTPVVGPTHVHQVDGVNAAVSAARAPMLSRQFSLEPTNPWMRRTDFQFPRAEVHARAGHINETMPLGIPVEGPSCSPSQIFSANPLIPRRLCIASRLGLSFRNRDSALAGLLNGTENVIWVFPEQCNNHAESDDPPCVFSLGRAGLHVPEDQCRNPIERVPRNALGKAEKRTKTRRSCGR